MARFEIKYVARTSNAVHAITEVGGGVPGDGWRCSVGSLLQYMAAGHTFFTVGTDRHGRRVEANVESFVMGGHAYIRTVGDGTTTDNLNSLPPPPPGIPRID